MRGINSKLLIWRDLRYVTSHVRDNRRVSHVGVGPSLLTYGAGTTRHSPAPLQLGPLLAGGGAIQLPITNSFSFNKGVTISRSHRCVARPRRGSVALSSRCLREWLRGLTHTKSMTCTSLRGAGELNILHRRRKSENYCAFLCNFYSLAPRAWMTRCLIPELRIVYVVCFVIVDSMSHSMACLSVTSQVDNLASHG